MLWRMHWDCLDAWYIGAFGIPPIEAFFGFELDMRYSYEHEHEYVDTPLVV